MLDKMKDESLQCKLMPTVLEMRLIVGGYKLWTGLSFYTPFFKPKM